MSSVSTPVGPFTAAYIGNYGQTSVLTQLTSVRTNGGTFQEALPSEYIVSVDGPVQVGNHTVRMVLTFLGTAAETTRLIRGLALSANINSPIGQNQYALFVVGPDNYYFPQVRTEKTTERRYSKNSPTVTEVTFTAEYRDVTKTLHYVGTLSELATTMGSQYPL